MGKDREAWCAQSMGLQRVRHNLATEQQSFGFSLQHCKCGIQTAVSAVFCAVSSWSCLLVSHQTWLLKTFSLWVHPVLCNGVSVLTFSYFQCQSLRGWRQKELWKTHGPPPCHPPPPGDSVLPQIWEGLLVLRQGAQVGSPCMALQV